MQSVSQFTSPHLMANQDGWEVFLRDTLGPPAKFGTYIAEMSECRKAPDAKMPLALTNLTGFIIGNIHRSSRFKEFQTLKLLNATRTY